MPEAIALFEKQLGYQLDTYQKAACESLLADNSVLVAAPTGAGKTTVAEFAIALARREFDLEVIYTAPIKALSNQKYAELCAVYGNDQVGLLTGDITTNPDAPIKIMTTEVLRNIIYSAPERLTRTHSIILDEVHFLGDPHRGPVWEEIILHLPAHVKIVGLSATVSNIEELGDWMHLIRGNTEVIISERRPVPLFQHVLTKNALLPMYVRGKFNREILQLKPLRARERRQNGSRRLSTGKISRATTITALAETGLLPAIVFIFSRTGCDQAVSQCLYDGVTLTSKAERAEIQHIVAQVVKEFSSAEKQVLRINTWVRGLERGIAAHHAGLLPQQKAVVEQLFQKRLLKVVFATETLALGINMPAKAVVLEQLKKFNGEERVFLSSGEFTQLTGRAGRRGIDDEGHAVILWEDSLDLELLQSLSGARSYPVTSRFSPTYNMAVNLLGSRTVPQVKATLERSFAQFQIDRNLVAVVKELEAAKISLAGYQNAAAKNTGDDAKRWHLRAKKMARRVRSLNREVKYAGGNITRKFEKVIAVLTVLRYLESDTLESNFYKKIEDLNAVKFNAAALVTELSAVEVLRPTVWGSGLARLHGERALLVLESLRNKIWTVNDPADFATLIGVLTYEPRRNDAGAGYQLNSSLQTDLVHTLQVYNYLAQLQQTFKFEVSDVPQSYNAWVLHSWAQKQPLDEILASCGLTAGDFIRWVKQTADLLGQIANSIDAILSLATDSTVSTETQKYLLSYRELAFQARSLINYGIVESSGQ